MLRLAFLDRFSDFGLLVLRVGIGTIFLFVHGFPHFAGGAKDWARIGRAMSYLGVGSGHTWWGLAALLSMTLGAICLIVGFCHRPAALALTGTMLVASIWRFYPFGGWDAAAYPVTMSVVCFSMVILGPGKYVIAKA